MTLFRTWSFRFSKDFFCHKFCPSSLMGCWLSLWLLGSFGAVQALANGPVAEPVTPGGSIEFEVGGQLQTLPMVSSNYQVQIDGNVANVQLRQTFVNEHNEPVHARYLFPLNKTAAVHRMRMRVGNEEIEAKIATIKKAEKTYQQAKSEGKAAAILRQHRPNMFTQRIANLMPGAPIEVELEYVQVLPKIDGEYELVIPTVVGPRYQPGVPASSINLVTASSVVDEPLPAYPLVPGLTNASLDNPQTSATAQLTLEVNINAGQRISGAASSTHQVVISEPLPGQRRVQLQAGAVIANRDFVLRYALAEPEVSAGLVGHWEAGDNGYFSLLIEPPLGAAAGPSVPREMVFLLDCSGSMYGLPMEASKAFMRRALAGLSPQDSFRIIRFSDVATEFSAKPLRATPVNVSKGLAYTESLQGSGGTVMSSGVYQALASAAVSGQVRQVVFLTDGYIGNEQEILRLVTMNLGDARLYAFGVGTSVNRYLLDELARVGQGFSQYMDPTADVEEAATSLAARLQHPVLTQLSIDWQELPVTDVLPAQLPDLFAGQSVQIQGRYLGPAAGNLVLHGLSAGGEKVQFERWVEFTSSGAKPALGQTWARAKVQAAMHQFTAPQRLRERAESGGLLTDEDLQAQVTELGLKHRLVTQWTAFVAVSKTLVNPEPGLAVDAQVPLARVAGVANSAYPAAAFTGYGTPEPSELASLLMLLLLAGIYFWVNGRSKLAGRFGRRAPGRRLRMV